MQPEQRALSLHRWASVPSWPKSLQSRTLNEAEAFFAGKSGWRTRLAFPKHASFRKGCSAGREVQAQEDDAIAATAAACQSFDGIRSVACLLLFPCANSKLRLGSRGRLNVA